MEGCTFKTPSATVSAPCNLTPANEVAEAFNKAAGTSGLRGEQTKLAGVKEHLVAAMRSAATSYDTQDELSAAGISGTGPSGVPQMRQDPASAAPVSGIGESLGGEYLNPVCFADDTYSDIEAGQAAITAPDDCASLLIAMDEWMQVATSLDSAAADLPTSPSHWDGLAAPTAYARITDLKGNLLTLADAWRTLASRANGFTMAHQTFKNSHTEVYAAYKENEALAKANPGNNREYVRAMAEQITTAEQIRRQYGKACELPKGPLPRTGGDWSPAPWSTNPIGSAPTSRPTNSSPTGGGTPSAPNGSGGGGTPSAGSGGGAPTGSTPADGSPSAAGGPTAPQGAPQGSEAGKGGQPLSGGMPSGGMPSGGSPSGGVAVRGWDAGRPARRRKAWGQTHVAVHAPCQRGQGGRWRRKRRRRRR